jgi:hypothetical protein
MTIYNAIHDGDEYRITKFNVDGNVQSSYTCNHVDCTCPAGSRDTCRHRQMLPTFLEHNLVNSHLFLDWDNGRRIVDFNGRAAILPTPERQTFTIPEGYEAVRDAEGRATGEVQPATVQSNETPELTGLQEEMILMGFHQPEMCQPDLAQQDPINDLFNLPQYHGVSIKTVDDLAPQALTDTYTSTPERDLAKQRLHAENYGTKPANGWRRF